MESPTLYYTLSTLKNLAGYRDNTIMFSSGDQQLVVYDSLEKVLGEFSKDNRDMPIVMKFEMPTGTPMPTQLGLDFLTQVGLKEGTSQDSVNDVLKEADEIFLDRISFVHTDNIQTDYAVKLEYMRMLLDYRVKMERYMKSGAEALEGDHIDKEIVMLMGPEYEHVFGENHDMVGGAYGFTLAENMFIHETRGVFNKLGSYMGKAMLGHGEGAGGLSAGDIEEGGRFLGLFTGLTEMLASDRPIRMGFEVPRGGESEDLVRALTGGDLTEGTHTLEIKSPAQLLGILMKLTGK
ncbi:MAG: hypothetical protein ABIJ08_01350 [Nanoarchaeota archaeon]